MQAFLDIRFITHHPSSKKKNWQYLSEIFPVTSQGTFKTLKYISEIGGDCHHKSRRATTALPKAPESLSKTPILIPRGKTVWYSEHQL